MARLRRPRHLEPQVRIGQNDEWQTSSRYMMGEVFARIETEEIDPVQGITTKAA